MQIQIDSRPQPGSQSGTKPGPRHRTPAQRERYILASILGLSLAIQLLFAPYQGFFQDVQIYLGWGAVFDAHPLTFYSLTGANYPPLTIYTFAVVELLYHGVGHVLRFSDAQLMIPVHNQFAVLWLMAKLPLIAANLGSSWLIYRLARGATSARFALLAALAYAVAPSMILDGAIWGQTDGVPIFFLLLAIVAIQAQRPVWAGALLGLAVMVKPQPVIFIPILLWYVLLTAGWRDLARASLAGLITILLICSPFLLPPHIQMLDFYHNIIHYFGDVSVNAYNFWFLIEWLLFGGSLIYQTPLVGSLTAGPIGIILFAPVYILALFLVWRHRSVATLYMAMALVAVGFFDLTALQHERYLFQALAFILLAAVHYRSFVLHFAVASITVSITLLLVCLPAAGFNRLAPPLSLFFSHVTMIVFITALLNLQLLTGIIVSSVAWMRGSSRGGGETALAAEQARQRTMT